MGSVITLRIVGMFLAFLIAVLADFPIDEALTFFDTNDESYSVEAVHEVGKLFTGNVTTLIDEMVSYQTDPNYARAEARRQDMVDLGYRLTDDFSGFQAKMEGELSLKKNRLQSRSRSGLDPSNVAGFVEACLQVSCRLCFCVYPQKWLGAREPD
jgi:hypothetical protein